MFGSRSRVIDPQPHWRGEKERLLVAYDQLYGITSRVEDITYAPASARDDRGAITHRTLVRDARLQDDRDLPNPNDPIVLSIDFKMRALSLMRAIHYTLSHKIPEMKGRISRCRDRNLSGKLIKILKVYEDQTRELEAKYVEFTSPERPFKDVAEIKNAEKSFNTACVRILHEANLDDGVEDQAGYEKLLLRYRTFASLLDPPLAMKTQFSANGYFFEEMAIPISEKTEAQKAKLGEVYSGVDIASEEKNAHTACSAAFQEVDMAFATLLKENMMGPQGRKMVPEGIKNGYHVYFSEKNRDDSVVDEGDQKRVFMLTRMGMPVYVGPGEPIDSGGVATTRRSLVQLHDSLNNQGFPIFGALMGSSDRVQITYNDSIQFVVLVSDFGPAVSFFYDHNKEHQMCSTLRNTCMHADFQQDDIIFAPFNVAGRVMGIEQCTYGGPLIGAASTSLTIYQDTLLPGEGGCYPGLRFRSAVDRITATTQIVTTSDGKHIVVLCASAMDRTGTECEAAIDKMAATWHSSWTLGQQRTFNGQQARSLHNPVLANLNAPPGHTGMKKKSQSDGYFSDETNALLYRDVSTGNKKTPIDPSGELLESLKPACQIANIEFDIAHTELERVTSANSPRNKMAREVLTEVKRYFPDATRHEQNQLTELLRRLKNYVVTPDEKNLKKLNLLSQRLKGKSSKTQKMVGYGLMGLGALSLVAGVLLFIPTLGLSTSLAGIGFAISATALGMICVAGGLTAIGVGDTVRRPSGDFKMPRVASSLSRFVKENSVVTTSVKTESDPLLIGEMGEIRGEWSYGAV